MDIRLLSAERKEMNDKGLLMPVAVNGSWCGDGILCFEKLSDIRLLLVRTDENETNGRTVRTLHPVTSEEMKEMGVDTEEAFERAKEAFLSRFPPMIEPLYKMLGLTDEDVDSPFFPPLFVLYNKELFFGGTMLFIPSVLEMVHEFVGKDFYIIPSSINELLILPCLDCDPESIREHIHYVNTTVCSKEEVLSEELYIYRKEEGRVLVA